MIGEGFGMNVRHDVFFICILKACGFCCTYIYIYVSIYNIHVSIQLTITVTIRYFLVVFGRQFAGKQNHLLPWLICPIFEKIVWKAKLTDLDIGMI